MDINPELGFVMSTSTRGEVSRAMRIRDLETDFEGAKMAQDLRDGEGVLHNHE
jgi:hypothetical protein